MVTFTSESLESFKAKLGVSSLNIKKSRKSGKFYACKEDNTFIGMVADDYKDKPLSVLHCADSDTGETWDFICSLQPTPTIDAI